MIQKITQNNGNFWTAKIVNQSSDFPVRRTGSYRHKKALVMAYNWNCNQQIAKIMVCNQTLAKCSTVYNRINKVLSCLRLS